MMIHQQLLPQKPLLHIRNTSAFFLSGDAAHSNIFRKAEMVQKRKERIALFRNTLFVINSTGRQGTCLRQP